MLRGIHLTILKGIGIPLPLPREDIENLVDAEVIVDTAGASAFGLTFSVDKNSERFVNLLLKRSVKSVAANLSPGGADANSAFSGLSAFAGAHSDERLLILATVNGRSEVLVDGIVTETSASPGGKGGKASVSIKGTDLTELFRRTTRDGENFTGMPVVARVAKILARYLEFGIVPKIVPPLMSDVPLPIKEIPAQHGTDLDYLKLLAQRAGYVFYLSPGPVPLFSTAYWGPEIRLGEPQPALTVDMDPWTNVSSLDFTIKESKRTQFFARVTLPFVNRTVEIPLPNISLLRPPLSLRLPEAKQRQAVADASTLSIPDVLLRGLSNQAESDDCVEGRGTLDTGRYGRILKARQLVGVRGAGRAFDGLHYVRKVTHNIRPGSYQQSFELVREGLVSNIPTVPV